MIAPVRACSFLAFALVMLCVPYAVAQDVLVPNCDMEFVERAMISADRPGIISEMEFQEGDRVKAGQLVSRLRDEVAQAIVNTAAKEVENDVSVRAAKATAMVADAERDQAKQANATDPSLTIVTRYELRRLELSAEQTWLEVEQAEHEFGIKKLQLEEARARLKEHEIRTPIDGLITRTYKHIGEAIWQQDVVMEIVNDKVIKVEGFIDVRNSFQLRPGMSVKVQLQDSDLHQMTGNQVFDGKITFIDNSVDPVTQEVRIRADVNNKNGILRPGLHSQMTIPLNNQAAN